MNIPIQQPRGRSNNKCKYFLNDFRYGDVCAKMRTAQAHSVIVWDVH